jgi:hypothetical protein
VLKLSGKASSFNAIGGVTGTQHATESRTNEQADVGEQKHLKLSGLPT